MSLKQILTLALLFAGLSVWIGLQLGLERTWIAGVFLFVIPVLVLAIAVAVLRPKAPPPVPADELEQIKNEIVKLLPLVDGVAEIKQQLARIEQQIAAKEAAHGN
jgi:hypothetical protein